MQQNYFDDKAGEWDSKSFRRQLADAVSGAIGRLPLDKHMRALDFGCGTGLISLPLAPRLGTIVALDSSPGMIEVLRQKLAEAGIDNIEPHCGDLLADEIAGGFDLVYTSMALHHIKDIGPILARFFDLLGPGGRLAIADLDAEDGSFHSTEAGEAPHHGFAREDFAAALENAGFVGIAFSTAHTISKTTADGVTREFPVFLASAEKR